MVNRAVTVLATVVVVVGPSIELRAQDAPRPTFRSGVATVRVDVSVTSSTGPVADLTTADFAIEEDGVAQAIETCEFIRLTGERMTGHDDSLVIRSPDHAEAEASRDDVRVFVVFFDDYHVGPRPEVTIPVRRLLREFVSMLGQNDLMAIVDPLTPTSALQLTRDTHAVLERIRTVEGREGVFYPPRSMLEEAQLQTRDVTRLRAEVTLSALEALVVKLGTLGQTRKSVLFVSQGPPSSLATRGPSSEPRLRAIFDQAGKGHVVIHTLDPRGLGAGRGRGSDLLHRLALETGGRAVVGTNAFTGGLERIVSDASAYYLLGYTPRRDDADGRFRRIRVHVKRRGMTVTARAGYWAPRQADVEASAAAAARPIVAGVADAFTILAASARASRPVRAWIGRDADGESGGVTVAWNPGEAALAAAVAALDVEVLAATDEPDAPVVARGRIQAAAPGANRGLRLAVPPGPTRLRLTARSVAGDAVDRWTEVLGAAKRAGVLSLDDTRFHRADTPAQVRALRDGDAVNLTAVRRFRAGERVVLETTARGVREPDVVVELLSGGGDALVGLPVVAHAAGVSVTSRAELPIASLGLGRYIVRVTVRGAGGSLSALDAFDVVRY